MPGAHPVERFRRRMMRGVPERHRQVGAVGPLARAAACRPRTASTSSDDFLGRVARRSAAAAVAVMPRPPGAGARARATGARPSRRRAGRDGELNPEHRAQDQRHRRQHPAGDRLVEDQPAEQDRHDRVHIGVGADDRGGGVLQRVAERGVAHERSDDDQIGHRAEAGAVEMQAAAPRRARARRRRAARRRWPSAPPPRRTGSRRSWGAASSRRCRAPRRRCRT